MGLDEPLNLIATTIGPGQKAYFSDKHNWIPYGTSLNPGKFYEVVYSKGEFEGIDQFLFYLKIPKTEFSKYPQGRELHKYIGGDVRIRNVWDFHYETSTGMYHFLLRCEDLL